MVRAKIEKPFPEFKWRWASFQPSEGLNEPPVFLGVLRALHENAGEVANSNAVFDSLRMVENDLQGKVSTRLNLARDRERNLLRNSQQYWSALGLLAQTQPTIGLTQFGQDVATGDTTVEEFAAAVVRSLTLPNVRIENPAMQAAWLGQGISVKPLSLILKIILDLFSHETKSAFLTNEELTRVVVPLSSLSVPVAEHVEHILAFRANNTAFDLWDDFVPAANDRRISREFLLFLSWHGFLVKRSGTNYKQKFQLEAGDSELVASLLDLQIPSDDFDAATNEIVKTGEIGTQQRQRKQVTVLSRPQQARFRKDVMKASRSRCLLTGETLKDVLIACHIIPVSENGSDDVGNGLCLRDDVHILFDAGHIRIHPDGSIHLSVRAKTSKTYGKLPGSVKLPNYVDTECIRHRWTYQG